ncbi:MAG: acyl-CoA dehydrogenase family protein, partial [Hyphomicrobiales bacterium]
MLDKSDAQASSFGAWELPEELQTLRDTVRRFMVNEVKPIEDKLEHDAVKCSPEDLKSLQAKAKALGLWQIRTPAEFGGAGLNLLGQAIVAEEAAKCRMGAYIPGLNAFGSDPPNVIWLGSKHQIEKY